VNLFVRIFAFLRLGAFNASVSARNRVSTLLVFTFFCGTVATPLASYSLPAPTTCSCCNGKICACHRHDSANNSHGTDKAPAWRATTCPSDCGLALASGDSHNILALPSAAGAFWLVQTSARLSFAAIHISSSFDAARFQRPPPRG
jgi:hypothetical protein